MLCHWNAFVERREQRHSELFDETRRQTSSSKWAFFALNFIASLIEFDSGYTWALEKDFWTSGTSTGCAGKFEWCSKKAQFSNRELLWKNGHPLAAEACVTLSLHDKISGKNSSLATAACQKIKPFICEAINCHSMIPLAF